MRKKYIWMCVTQDRYELPVAIADSASQLARLMRVSENSVSSAVSHYEAGRYSKSKYIRVEVEE